MSKSTIKHGTTPDGQAFHLYEDVLFGTDHVGLDLTNIEFNVTSWEGLAGKGLQTKVTLQVPRTLAVKLGLLPEA
jgi:hypothetical protein